MKKLSLSVRAIFWLFCLFCISSCGNGRQGKVIVFSKTDGFRHSSIEDGIAAIKKLGRENNFTVYATEDASKIKEEILVDYDAVIFLNTTQDILDHVQQADFERFIQAGGGFVGIHAAADTEYEWPWYGRLVGAYFSGHPSNPNVRTATLNPLIKDFAATKMLPDDWERTDEWYNYKDINPDINVLINLDEKSYEGGTNGDSHPIAWYHEYDGGRSFFTGGGHTSESFVEPLFLEHLVAGIRYAIGEKPKDYALAKTKRVPPANRFVKTVLAQNLNEPMEFEIFDDGKVLFVERKGAIKLYDPESGYTDSIGAVEVYNGQEDGLLGITKDPDYANNNSIYFFYSPVGDKPVQNVSRFQFNGKKVDLESEQLIIEIPVQRDECCHSGGSLEFGADGNLYIGVGDDTNPFASDGYAPIDERKGRKPWDAQRTSGNMNDLRGGILRITPNKDKPGYTIPKGNLFPEGTPNTKPELYVKGCRNPFRFGIDSRTGWVYWGDVGPDAGVDNEGRGPKGIDEVNQARKAGYFGWPYFRGARIYKDYDFTAEKSGEEFNPKAPINDSPNNTGPKELPPFNESLVWYSYDKSNEYPWVGIGGKNPMAAPIYYSEDYDSEVKYPDYFDGKPIAYEWMRNWFYIINLDENGDYVGVDPFMEHLEFSRPMDVQYSKDGVMYVLEYGQKWFARNIDARLSRIDYVRGNREPIAKIEVDKIIGAAPMTVAFKGSNSQDYDEDKLKYEWTFEGGEKSNKANATHTFKSAGIYKVELKVTDPDGKTSIANQEIQVGNDAPAIAWELEGNETFYWDNRNINYNVKVADKEDGNSEDGTLDKNKISVSFDYLDNEYDLTTVAQGHLAAMNASGLKTAGESLIDQSDCKTCHAVDKKINGPSYKDIAKRYREEKDAPGLLAAKIIKGGAGNWGETVMSAHPQITEGQAAEMVKYIMSLGLDKVVKADRPLEGAFNAKDHITPKKKKGDMNEVKGNYILMASYTDQGNGDIDPITAQEQIVLRHARLQAEKNEMEGGEISNNGETISILKNNSYIGFKSIDLTDVTELLMKVGYIRLNHTGTNVDIRIGSADGKSIGKGKIERLDIEGKQFVGDFPISIEPTSGKHDVYFVFNNGGDNSAILTVINWIYFKNKSEISKLSYN